MDDIYQSLIDDKTIYSSYSHKCPIQSKNLIGGSINHVDPAPRINKIFANFDFKAYDLFIAGGFYSSQMPRDYDIYCFGNLKRGLMALINHLKPEFVFVSINSVTFIVNNSTIQVIHNRRGKNAYDIVSGFDISACEVWFDGELHFTARAKYTFETNIMLINKTPESPVNKYRIFKYTQLYSIYVSDAELKAKKAYGLEINENMKFVELNITKALSFDNVLEFNQIMMDKGKYNQLIGRFTMDEILPQIAAGIIRYEPYCDNNDAYPTIINKIPL